MVQCDGNFGQLQDSCSVPNGRIDTMTDAKYKKFDHVSIAVKDAAKVIETWTNVLGIGPWSSHDLSGTDAKGRPWKASTLTV